MISSGSLALPLHRGRRSDRRRQDGAGGAPRHAPRRDARARGDGQSVSRRLLRRPRRRRAAGPAVLPPQSPSPADARCVRRICSARSRSATISSTRTRSSRTSISTTTSCSSTSGSTICWRATCPPPDLVVYLQAPTDVLLRRLRGRPADPEGDRLRSGCRVPPRAERGLSPLLLSLRLPHRCWWSRPPSSTPRRATRRSTIS